MRTLKKKDIKKYKVNLKEGGYDNSEKLGDYYQEAIEEFLNPILKKLNPVKSEDIVMKIYDNMFPEMDESANTSSHVENYIKNKYPKLYQKTKIAAQNPIDELVDALGGSISGDEKNVNNTEIRTSPQQTGDDYAASAIQPNRLYFNALTAVGKSNATNNNDDSDVINAGYVVAKEKMFNLLESLTPEFETTDQETITDINSNDIPDINELPSNVASKLNVIIKTIENNNLNSSQILILINHMLTKISNKIEPKDRELIKSKL